MQFNNALFISCMQQLVAQDSNTIKRRRYRILIGILILSKINEYVCVQMSMHSNIAVQKYNNYRNQSIIFLSNMRHFEV